MRIPNNRLLATVGIPASCCVSICQPISRTPAPLLSPPMNTKVLHAGLLLSLTVFNADHLPGQEKGRATAVPSQSADEAVERFVKECVAITPGKANFPVKFSVGVRDPGKHEMRQREVNMDYGFRISKFETTQELYQAVAGVNPSRWKGPRNSVESVSFNDVERFCQKLTVMLQEEKLIRMDEMVRLPTSIEWEYCCRAGTSTRYSFGDAAGAADQTEILDAHAWHTGNAAGNDPAVGVLKPNPWGLHDVHGYLWEFVSDGPPPESKENPESRVIRGGSWRDAHPLLSSSSYFTIPADGANDAVGFRCVIAEKPETKNPSRQ